MMERFDDYLFLTSNGFSTRNQQEKAVVESKSEYCIDKFPIITSTPLYSNNIWAYTWREKAAAVRRAIIRVKSVGNIAENIFDKVVELFQFCSVINMAKTKHGLQLLQELLSLNDPNITWEIIEGAIEFTFELMTNQHGHYLFEKLIQLCDVNQLQLIVEKIISESELFVEASLNKYSSNSIKKLIKAVRRSSRLVSKLSLAIYRVFYDLMINRVGHAVVLQCLYSFDSIHNNLLYEAAVKNCLKLATHEKGYLSLNDFITNSRQPYRNELLQLISQHSVYLSQDPVGHFVVQHVIDLSHPAIVASICSKLQGHYINLSLQKTGSHVVEKCLNSQGMNYVLDEFLKSQKLSLVARNQFGNYVVKNALKVTKRFDNSMHYKLMMKLQPHLRSLRFGFGKHVYNLIVDGVPLD